MKKKQYENPKIEVVQLLEDDVLMISAQRSWLGKDEDQYQSDWYEEEV